MYPTCKVIVLHYIIFFKQKHKAILHVVVAFVVKEIMSYSN